MMAAQSSTMTDPVATQIAAEIALEVAAELEKSLKSEKVVTAAQLPTQLSVLQGIQSGIGKLTDIDLNLANLSPLTLLAGIDPVTGLVTTVWDKIPENLRVKFQLLLDQGLTRYDDAKTWLSGQTWLVDLLTNPNLTMTGAIGVIVPRISSAIADMLFGVITGVDLFTVHLADEMTDSLDLIKQAAARRELAEVQASQLSLDQQFNIFKQATSNLSGVVSPTVQQFRQQQRQAIHQAVSTIMNNLGNNIAQQVEQPFGGTGGFIDNISPWKEMNAVAGDDIAALKVMQTQLLNVKNQFLSNQTQASLQLMRSIRTQMMVRFFAIFIKLAFVTMRNVYTTIVQPVVERAIQLVREAFRALGNIIARFGPVAAKLGLKAVLLPVDFAAWKAIERANEKHAARLVKKGKDPTKVTLAGDKWRFFANRIGINTDKGTVLFFIATVTGATLLVGLPLGWVIYRSFENRVQDRDIIKKMERAKELGIADRIEITLDDL